MKILVFEYLTGGGLNRQELPESLANEGRLMLQALIDGLSALDGLELTVMLDRRMVGTVNLNGCNRVVIGPEEDCHCRFENLAEFFDAVWPVAPESGGVLQALCHSVERLGKILLTSPSSAAALCGDKFLTYQRLRMNEIATVPTQTLDMGRFNFYPGENIVKPVDGIGCEDSYVLSTQTEKDALTAKIAGKGRYIVQPHLHGKKASLSCLFKEGRSWLLCANLQKFTLVDRQYHLSEIIVNHTSDWGAYRQLAAQVANAFPELWGYAGIDLIETSDQMRVLEINPRLTTSFAGIDKALGLNPAVLVLDLIEGEPILKTTCNRAVSLTLIQDQHELA